MAAPESAPSRSTPPDLLDAAFAVVTAVVAAAAWSALTLAEASRFTRNSVLALTILVAVSLLWWMWRRREPVAWRADWRALLWMVLLLPLAALPLRWHADAVVDGLDDTVYLDLGSMIASRGGLAVVDPLLAATPPPEWPALLSRDRFWPRRLNRFEGGVQVGDVSPALEPNFFHLLPAWIAVFDAFGGPGAGPLAAPALSLLVPVGVFLLTRRLAGVYAAMAASALVALNAAQIWASASTLSEASTAALLTSGTAFAVWWLEDRTAMPAVMTGIAIGLAGLCRVDALLLSLPVVFLVLAVDRWIAPRGRSHRLAMWLPLLALVIQAVVHALTIAAPYTLRMFRHLAHARSLLAAAGFALVASLVLLVAAAKWTRRASPSSWRSVTIGPALVMLATGWIAWHMRPDIQTNHLVVALSPLGLLVALLGLARASTERDLRYWLVVGTALVWALAYGASARDTGMIPNVFRRDVPVLLPMGAVLAGALLFPRVAAWWHRAIGIVVLGILLAAQLPRLPWLADAAATGASRDSLRALASAVPAGSLVLVERGLPGHLPLSLDVVADRTALAAGRTSLAWAALRGLVDRTAARGHAVFVVAPAAKDPPSPPAFETIGLSLAPVTETSFVQPQLRPTVGQWPTHVDRRVWALALYRAEAVAGLPWRLDVGAADYGALGPGWLGAETLYGESARWTTGTAQVMLPHLDCSPGVSELRLRLASIRPPGVAQPAVDVAVADQQAGRLIPDDSAFRVYALPLTPDLGRRVCDSPATMTLRAPTFVPANSAGSVDQRTLGIAVDWLELTTVAAGRSRE